MSATATAAKTVTLEQVRAARREFDTAAADCAHWDWDNPDGDDFTCCTKMRMAESRWERALTAYRQGKQS